MNFQLSIKNKILENKEVLYIFAFKLSQVFIMLINVKMPTIVGILTFKNTLYSLMVKHCCGIIKKARGPRGPNSLT